MSRLFEELKACGCTCNRVVDGIPILESGDQSVAKYVVEAHVHDDDEWIAVDLEAHAEALRGMVSSTQWEAYVGLQDAAIEAKREEEYWGPDGPYRFILKHIADDNTFTSAREGAVARKKAIDDARPKPTKTTATKAKQ